MTSDCVRKKPYNGDEYVFFSDTVCIYIETRNGQACMIGLRDARTDHLTGNAERGIQQTNQLEKVKEMFTAIKNNFTRGYDILNNPAHIFAYLGFRVGF